MAEPDVRVPGLAQEAEGALQAAEEQLRTFEEQVGDARAQIAGLEADLVTMEADAAKVRTLFTPQSSVPRPLSGYPCSVTRSSFGCRTFCWLSTRGTARQGVFNLHGAINLLATCNAVHAGADLHGGRGGGGQAEAEGADADNRAREGRGPRRASHAAAAPGGQVRALPQHCWGSRLPPVCSQVVRKMGTATMPIIT